MLSHGRVPHLARRYDAGMAEVPTLTLAEIDAWWHNDMLAHDGVPWRDRSPATRELLISGWRKIFPARAAHALKVKIEGSDEPFSFEGTMGLLTNGPGWLEDPPVCRRGRLNLPASATEPCLPSPDGA